MQNYFQAKFKPEYWCRLLSSLSLLFTILFLVHFFLCDRELIDGQSNTKDHPPDTCYGLNVIYETPNGKLACNFTQILTDGEVTTDCDPNKATFSHNGAAVSRCPCTYVCQFMCMCVTSCVCVCVCMCVYVCVRACVHARVHACVCMCACVRVSWWNCALFMIKFWANI